MSTLALFGIAVLATLAVLAALFWVALLGGTGTPAAEESPDDDAVDQSFTAHGGHLN
ncbi:hypothetical protein [Salinactinospora qingdaonensis]|uniref:Uncharacterized protein n=1 Tax=Salinactinospora qingdaonensis TaxID=702744 RepID=A0ABP7F087_9ACTN